MTAGVKLDGSTEENLGSPSFWRRGLVAISAVAVDDMADGIRRTSRIERRIEVVEGDECLRLGMTVIQIVRKKVSVQPTLQ